MNMEDKEFMEKYILNNPFEFKQEIISHCRKMDKIDVYNWVAKDELKINKLQQENKQLKDNWNKLKECLKDVMNSCNGDDKDFVKTILDIMREIEQGSDSDE